MPRLSFQIIQRTAVVLAALLSTSCDGERFDRSEDLYVFNKPEHFPPAVYTFNNNPVTKDGFELGRLLFYDPALSLDSTVACANCHQQAKGFSDPVHRFSKGVGDVDGFRNAPAIQNTAFQSEFFWDGGVNHLDFVPINAITSKLEMRETLETVVEKLQETERYKTKFNNVFGSDEVTSQRLLFALSQFMNMLVSSNSRYDNYLRGSENLTADELSGLSVFQMKCAGCHATSLFTDQSFRNNGLDSDFGADPGREQITEAITDRGKFKVPSLRNAELTFPYMHDGRFRTLGEVIDHYRQDVKDSPTLDVILKRAGRPGIDISDDEKDKLIVFIKTLTDREFILDKRFSNPSLK